VDEGFVDLSARRQPAVGVEGQGAPAQHEVVQQRGGRAGIEGDHLVLVDEGDVTDTAQIEHHHRLGKVSRQGAMIERREGRALTAGRHVGSPEPADRVDPQPLSDARGIAQLAGEAAVRPVQHGLTVQPDQANRAALQPKLRHEGLERRRVGLGHLGFQRGQGVTFRPFRCRKQRQQLAAREMLLARTL